MLDLDGDLARTARVALAGIAEVERASNEASATAALRAGIEAMEPHAAALIGTGLVGGDAGTVERARLLWSVAPELEVAVVVVAAHLRAERFARPEQVTLLPSPVDPEQLRVAIAGAQARFARRALTRAAGDKARMNAHIVELEREVSRLGDEARSRHESDAERARVEKLESLSRLAAGLGHELNTPLQFVGDNLSFLGESFQALTRLGQIHRQLHREIADGLPLTDAVARARTAERAADIAFVEKQVPLALAECDEGLRRVREIVQTMKEFAAPAASGEAVCDVNEALTRALVLARSECEKVADIETDLGDVPRARCSAEDLHQVLYILIMNAAQAIADRSEDGSRGTVRLATRLYDEQVVITVADDGCGIPEHVRPRIFEHFFTTREVGRGTGQGLALAWALVAQKHGGALRFESEVGHGTTFEIRLNLRRNTMPPL